MRKNEKLQIRLSEELSDYCKKNFPNVSLFIREAIREKIDSGVLPDSSLEFVEIRAKNEFTYSATLVRVIDGDTILLDFDLGFFINIKERVRLAGIDCPPIDTPEGMKATQFIEKELTGASLIVETRKKEKFGRYLSWIYYSKEYDGFEDIIRNGKMINDELVKAGLAKKYVG